MSQDTLAVEGYEIKFDNADKVLFPDDGITKEDLALYYISNVLERLGNSGDAWRNLRDKTYSIAGMKRRFDALK